MKKRSLFLLLIVCFQVSRAQYFQTGQDPASIRWRQINTPNFQVIFPGYFEEQAQKLALKLEKVYEYGSYSLDYKPRKISVILHTQTVKSNGLVAWAPRRAEFYTTPHQSIYPQDWLEQLALHEFRHVVQVDKLDSHLPGLIKTILGEQGTALVFGTHLPWWLIEGDAVVTETALSHYGRGRLPSFLMEHRAQVVQKGVFSYDKAYFGSYKDFVPNHYKLGYYLVGNARARNGIQLWEDVLNRSGKKPVTFSPLNKVLKKHTGFKKTGLYRSIFDSLHVAWNEADRRFKPQPSQKVSPPNRFYSSYIHNHWLNDSTIISLKRSFDEIPSFVKIEPGGKEEKIFFPGTIFNESVSFRDNWIVWSEHIPDPRWEHSGHSLLRLFNIQTKQRIEIKPQFKSFSPVLSPEKTKLVVVETDFSNNYFLTVYQLPSGKMLKRFQSQENNYFFSPAWLNDDEVAAVVLARDGKRLVRVNFDTAEMTILLEKELGNIKSLRVSDGSLYFIGSWSGKNSLYRYHLNTREVDRLYEPRFGVDYPALSPGGDAMVLSDYEADGFRLIEVPVRAEERVPLSGIKKASYPLAEALAAQEKGIPDLSLEDTTAYPSEKYSKAAHLFQFHSWAPLFIDANAYEFTPGASLMSQNKLGTSETVLGYKWYLSEKAGQFYARYSWKGWYPVIDFEWNGGNRASSYSLIQQTKDSRGEVIRQDTTRQRYTWGENRGSFKIRLPLNLGKGAFNRYLQPEFQYHFSSYKRNESTPEKFLDGNFHSLGTRLYFHQLLRKSFHDVYPNFGLILDGTYRYSPGGTLDPGNIKALQSVLYLPGVLKSHGMKFYGGIQQTNNEGTISFSDVVKYARGWGRINTSSVFTATADYKMPLFYPDWNIGRLAYFQRVKLALFGDYSQLKGNYYDHGKKTGSFEKNIVSLGLELSTDANILRFYAPADIGFRASYLPELKNVYFDFLISIDFTAL